GRPIRCWSSTRRRRISRSHPKHSTSRWTGRNYGRRGGAKAAICCAPISRAMIPAIFDMGPAPAGNGRVIGNGLDRFARMPNMPDRSIRPGFGLDAAAEADLVREFRPRKFPRIAKRQPVFWIFELTPILDALAE